MEIKKIHIICLVIAFLFIGVSLVFFINDSFFFFIFGIGFLIGMGPFIFSTINETKIAAEKEEKFLEFARGLVESVRTGTPINKAIINVKNKPYGVLSEHVKKLANQISMGIPLTIALQTFSKDVDNSTISRAITLIGEAEKSGGEIGGILESVTEAVSMVDKLKKERKSAISSLTVQGYIIFIVFIVIVLVLQFQILPSLIGITTDTDISGGGAAPGLLMGSIGGGGGGEISQEEIASSFIYLLICQGFFTGLVIGKLSEKNIKAGLKHSFTFMILAFLISNVANIIFG